MQLRELMWKQVLQPPVEDVGEKVVVAVPAPFVVQWDQEQVHLFQGFQHRLSLDGFFSVCLDDRIT